MIKNIRDAVNTKMYKEKFNHYSTKLSSQLTISTGEIPSQWKEATVTPIYKTGRKDDENNYRPFSVLPLTK